MLLLITNGRVAMKTYKIILNKIIEQENIVEALNFDEALTRAKNPDTAVVSKDTGVVKYNIIEISEIDNKDIGK